MNDNTIVNYSKFKESDRRLYNLFGYSIPGGIDITFLLVSVVYLVIFNMIGIPISIATRVPYFDIKNQNYMFGMFMVILPFVFGFLTNKIKIQHYSIYDYVFHLIIYAIKPKNTSLHETGNDSSEKLGFYLEQLL